MKFSFKFLYLRLSNVWIKSLLHLFFQLIFPFPKQNLSLALLDLLHKFSFLFSYDIDIELKLWSLVLHFFEFFNKLALKVYIFVLQFLFFIRVISNIVIQLIHFLL